MNSPQINYSERYNINDSRKIDHIAIGIFFFYSLANALTRLIISTNMELDDSELFLTSSEFQWGYSFQPPLYMWVVKAFSSLFGLNIYVLIVVKHFFIFIFLIVFFKICRSLWDSKKSLYVTSSLMLFPLYLYEFNRDLSHTILLTVMASITCFLSLKILSTKKLIYYIGLGLSMGLGVLSKYNYLFLVLTLFLASISFQEGRNALFNKKAVIAIFLCIIITLPHIFWLRENDYTSLLHIIEQSRTGSLDNYKSMKVLSVLGTPLMEISGFFLLFAVFFSRYFSRSNPGKKPQIALFRWGVCYGLLIPLLVILVFQMGHFLTRWLAPIYILVPIAGFSIVNLESDNIRFKKFGFICASVAIAVLCARIFFGFLPDITGKVDRIHIPFDVLSVKLNKVLKENKYDNNGDFFIITDKTYIAANLSVRMPQKKFLCFDNEEKYISAQRQLLNKKGVLLMERSKRSMLIQKKLGKAMASNRVFHLEAPYLHSKQLPPYILDGIFIDELDYNHLPHVLNTLKIYTL